LVLDQAFVRLFVQRLFRQLQVVLQQPPRLLQRQLAAARAGVSELKGPGIKRKAHWRWAFMYSKRCLMAFLMALSVTCAVAFRLKLRR
jgi:hypothetical protein